MCARSEIEKRRVESEKTKCENAGRKKAGRVSVSFRQFNPLSRNNNIFSKCIYKLTQGGRDERGKDPGAVQLQYESCGGAPCICSKSRGRKSEGQPTASCMYALACVVTHGVESVRGW